MQERILVVEDDHLQQSILRSALEASGYEVETACDGLSAVWSIREGHYDLVLIDYQLPEIDGLATARLVSDIMGQAARPRIIALTAMPNRVIAREESAGKGFDGIIAKSADLPGLIATVARFIQFDPDRMGRRAAEADLLLKEWTAYEAVPDRTMTERGCPMLARILVVEDDEIQRSVVAAALTAQGYSVETASDGLSAVSRMREGVYDLALIDYELPEIDGLAAAKLIEDLLSEVVRPRMIALTAAPDRLARHAVQSNRVFDEVLGKLEGLPALLASVKRQLRSAPNRATRVAAERAVAGGVISNPDGVRLGVSSPSAQNCHVKES